jgi:outer membrane protein insertion porin family
MNSLVRRSKLFLVVFIASVAFLRVHGQTQPIVRKIDIQHVGPPASSDSLIRANIRTREGEPFLRASVNDDVKNLYSTGYFYNVRVGEETTADGMRLIYVVQGKPLLTDIKFSGNKKYDDKKLLKKVASKIGKPLDEKTLFSDALEIQKLYQKAGYQKTTIKPVPSIDENAGRGTVTFEITETPKVKIDDIRFVGAQAFKEKKLRKVLKTRRRWWMSWLTGSGVLKDDEFEDDKERLIEFYQNEGYIDFEIKDIKFDYSSPTKMTVNFFISEGQQYKVGAVTFKGNSLMTTNDFARGVVYEGRLRKPEMTVGKTFTPIGLSKDVETIRDVYGSRGYIDTRVNAIKRPNTVTGTMDLAYEIEEGDKSFIEKVEIKGNDKTKDRVIRRELAVSPGEVYDTVRVKLSKGRLEQMQYFDKVETQPETTDAPNRKNLVIGVEEKNTGNFTIGAGFSSVDSIVGFAELTQSNFDLFKPPTFTGAGQKFRLRASIGLERQDYQMSFIEPWFLGRKLALGVDLYHRELNFLSRLYDETRTGGSLSLTRAIGSEFLIGRLSYTLENVGIDFDPTANISPELRLEEGSRLVSKIGGSIAWDTRNNSLLPSSGQRTELMSELAGGPLGGETDFYKFELRSARYFPGFFEGHVLELAARSGVVESYDDSTRVPIFDRYFLGGLYSLRGYRYRQVGPRDSFGEPIGGKTYVFGKVEYSLPLIERLRFALFYDIGNVYEDAFSFDARGREPFSDNWGLGLRINLPIGPLRLDYGFPINHDPNASGSGRFQFGVGYTSEF